MFIETAAATIKIADDVFEHRQQLLRTIKKLRYWIVHRRLIVLTFGPAGTGKTTLASILSGNSDHLKAPGRYVSSLSVEEVGLPGDLVCTVVVAPGQRRYMDTIWPELYSNLPRGRAGGIINVVSYGYHAFTDRSYKDSTLYREEMTETQFLAAYQEERRRIELDVIQRLVPRISDTTQKIWMITLATKQDLWWEYRNDMREHYMKGAYNEHINAIRRAKGNRNFRHEYLSASLVISNWETDRGEVLAQNTAGYDQRIQIANLQALVNAVQEFAAYKAFG
jgi:energy-coupling factor transporter ATP-binding protein EcfA2